MDIVNFMRLATLVGVSTATALSSLTAPAFAQAAATASSGVPGISCYLPPLKLPEADIISFLERSDEDLRSFSSAGLPLSTRVRMLAASDVRSIAPILARVQVVAPAGAAPAAAGDAAATTAVAPDASAAAAPSGPAPGTAPATADSIAATQPSTPAPSVQASSDQAPAAQAPADQTVSSPAAYEVLQMKAIAEGLSAASIACSVAGNELGTLIQEEVAKTNNEPFIQAFLQALENQKQSQIETAALGTARGSASVAANIGNQGGDNGGGSQSFGEGDGVATIAGSLKTGTRGSLYFSADGSGGSDDDEISPTQP